MIWFSARPRAEECGAVWVFKTWFTPHRSTARGGRPEISSSPHIFNREKSANGGQVDLGEKIVTADAQSIIQQRGRLHTGGDYLGRYLPPYQGTLPILGNLPAPA